MIQKFKFRSRTSGCQRTNRGCSAALRRRSYFSMSRSPDQRHFSSSTNGLSQKGGIPRYYNDARRSPCGTYLPGKKRVGRRLQRRGKESSARDIFFFLLLLLQRGKEPEPSSSALAVERVCRVQVLLAVSGVR